MFISDDDMLAIVLILAKAKQLENNKRRKRRLWMNEWLKEKPNITYQNLLNEMKFLPPNDFKNFLRINICEYNELLELVKPLIEKKDTNMRAAIPVENRLSITLHYLATGKLFEDLKYTSSVSAQAIGKIVIETCKAIITVLKNYMKVPKTEDEWKSVADDFYSKWNFPNCLGAIDSKHVAIRKPKNSGTLFYNHKKFYSVILMAVVNANYEFMVVDVGMNGQTSGEEVLEKSQFGKSFYSNSLNLPESRALPNSERILPYTFIGDEHFLKPFADTLLSKVERIFNYRLNRALRIVENAFGLLTTRFGVFQRAINLEPEKIQIVVLACCYLHNFIRRRNSFGYFPRGFFDEENMQTGELVPGRWRNEFPLHEVKQSISGNSSNNYEYMREELCDYFNNEGQVSWQNNMV